jgi:hypothetical protein
MATRQRFHRSMTSPRPTVTVCRGGSQPQRISRICRTQHCINSASTAHRLRHRSSRKDDHEKSLALKSIRDACSSARLVSVEAGNVSEHPFGPNRAKILAATQTDFGPDRFRSSSLTTPASQSVSVGRSRFVRPVACDARVRSHLFVRRAQRLRSKQTLNFLDSILCTRPSAPPADRPAIYTRPGWTRKSRRAALLRHGRRRFRKIRKQGKKLARLGPKWTCGTSACLLTSPRLLI